MSEVYPRIANMGLRGILIQFGDTLGPGVNHAALAFRAGIEAEGWDGVDETTTALASVFVSFDPLRLPHAELTERLKALLDTQDWYRAAPPNPRRWIIPVALGGDEGPQFAEAAALAGVSEDQARAEIEAADVSVLTFGFAPGQPYMGSLPENWDIPRQTGLTARVPAGALVVAIRQLIIFTAPNPTGWRQIGQTAFECFRPTTPEPFPLRSGDIVRFRVVTPEALSDIRAEDRTGNGGATLQADAT